MKTFCFILISSSVVPPGSIPVIYDDFIGGVATTWGRNFDSVVKTVAKLWPKDSLREMGTLEIGILERILELDMEPSPRFNVLHKSGFLLRTIFVPYLVLVQGVLWYFFLKMSIFFLN